MLSSLKTLLASALIPLPSEEEYITSGYDEELDHYKSLAKGGKDELVAMCEREKKATGISSLKIKYNGVFGYFFEVPASQKESMPEYFIRKQTLSNAERYVTPELKQFEEQVLSAQQKVSDRQIYIWNTLQESILKEIPSLKKLARLISDADILQGFATASEKKNLSKPKILSHGRSLKIEQGRHLIVEESLKKQKKRFIPNSLNMPNKECFHLIRGPNMAGKSTFLRQNAIIIFLAHIGCFVPAESAEIPIMDAIFTRIGSGDSLSTGESTFLVEMQESARILRYSTDRSFLILDEIGRGTSTYDGLSIAWAIMENLHEKECKTLFATHYHELITLANRLKNAKNFSARVLEDPKKGVIFLHQIFEGGAEKSFGIEVGRLAGLPTSVIHTAEKILAMLEKNESSPIERGKQVSLFEMYSAPQPTLPLEIPESKVEKELKEINPNEITPLQALQILSEWKKKIR